MTTLYDPMKDPWNADTWQRRLDQKAENNRYRSVLASNDLGERVLRVDEVAQIQHQIGRDPMQPVVMVEEDPAPMSDRMRAAMKGLAAKRVEEDRAKANDLARAVMAVMAKHEAARPKGLPCPPGLANALACHRPVTTDHLEMRDRTERAMPWRAK